MLLAPSAAAQGPCYLRGKALAYLAKKYKEQPIALGVTNTGTLIELLTSPEGGTWTIIEMYPNGRSCLFKAGEGWRPLLPKEIDPEA